MNISFRLPRRADLLIFDTGGLEVLRSTVLGGLDHVVLDSRRQELHLTGNILVRFLANLDKVESFRPGQLYTAYLLACVQELKPKAVFTFVDNSEFFHAVARLHPQARFFAVQNGFRSEASVSPSDKHPRGWLAPGAVMYIPHFFCFGEYEAELYRRCGHEVGRYEPVGSLRAGYFKTEVQPRTPEPAAEVCLVSEWDAAIMKDGGIYPNIRLGVERLNAHLARYIAETGASISVAGRSRDPRERQVYEDLFGGQAVFVENDPAAYSSYRTMDAANVVVSLYSTAAFEAFGWGKKTLFCNLSGDETLSCPIPGPWSLTAADYEEFRKSMDFLRRADPAEYGSRAAARRMMAFDPARPAHRVIRTRLEEALA